MAKVYRDYIKSKQWALRKSNYYGRHDKICRACSTKAHIHLHHKTYARLGFERDADLVPLCRSCHYLVHNINKSSKYSLWFDTEQFIRDKKGVKWKKKKRRRSKRK